MTSAAAPLRLAPAIPPAPPVSLPVFRVLLASPLFWSVLAIKAVLGSLFASAYLRDLFIPFLNYFVASGLQNPWAHFAAEGKFLNFPYPPVMLYVLSVGRVLFAPFLAGGVSDVTRWHLVAMRLPLMACDILLLYLFAKSYPNRIKRVLLLYWCSPIVVYVCYWHGQLDIVPTAIFVLSLWYLRQKQPVLAMVLFGLGLAAKSHLWSAAPFLFIYLFGAFRGKVAVKAIAAAIAVYILAVLPFLDDPAFRTMVYFSSEQKRLFADMLPVGGGYSVLIAPSAIVLLWFRFAAYAKRNWDLLMLYLGVLFSIFILLAPPQPGYALWSLPFLIHYFCRAPRVKVLPYAAYAAGYIAFFLLRADSDLFDAFRLVSVKIASLGSPLAGLTASNPAMAKLVGNLTFTLMEASLAGTALYMYMNGVRSNAVYRMRSLPVLVGVAGDSGAGKDTFIQLFTAILGLRNATVVSGDDYHRWPRGHDVWKVATHLNASSNRLHEQQEHGIALHQGRTIYKVSYNHDTGQFTDQQALDPNHVVIFQGLHALTTVELRQRYDLRVFLDPDEHLRVLWKLERDSKQRGHSPEAILSSLDQRRPDRTRYIVPQRDFAELVIRWTLADPQIEDASSQPELALEILASNSFDLEKLVAALAAEPALSVEHEPYWGPSQQRLRLRGTVSSKTLHDLYNGPAEEEGLIEAAAPFAPGLSGCLQLIAIECLKEKLRWQGQILWLD